MPDGSFFHRYINDAYRFLSEDDRQFLSEFWTAMIQMAGDVEQQLLEASLNRYLGELLTFSVDRWHRYSFGIAAATTAVVTETVTFTGAASVPLQNPTLLSFGLLLTRTSSGFQFSYGTDYTVDFAAGAITRPAGSAITLGTPATLRYTHVTSDPVVAGYPYVMSVDARIVSIPILQDAITVVAGTTLLYENVDFVVGSGSLSFKVQPPPHMWAERTFVDDETPYRRFGVLIDYYLANSPQYVQALRGLYFAYFKGSQVETIENAIRLMLGLPSAFRAGTITHVLAAPIYARIDTISKPYTITTAFGEPSVAALHEKGLVHVVGVGGYSRALRVRSATGNVIELYEDAFDDYDSASPPPTVTPADVQVYIPRQVGYLGDDNVLRYEEVFPDLTILVAVGQAVTRYQPFVSGTQIIDKLVNPDFVIDEVGRTGIQRFLTDAATTGPGPTTDESIALDTLSSHLWVVQIHGAVFNSVIKLSDVVTFIERIKPQYTEYIFQILESFLEAAAILESEEKDLEVDLTYTINSNIPNVESFAIQMELVSFIQATGVLTVASPHDLTVFGAAGETVVLTGLDVTDDGEYTIGVVTGATTMVLGPLPASNWAAPPAAARVYVMGTDAEYTAAGAYPYLGIGAGHPYVNEAADAVMEFSAELHEIRVAGGPTYFLDSNPATPTHFTLWDLDISVDKVTVAGAANAVNNAAWTVVEVVSDATLRIAGGGGPVLAEAAGIGGTITITKTLPL
jgi:hypothetical protein